MYICFVQNHTAVKSLGWRTPTEWLLGYTPDISVLLQFEFWEPVYYAKYDAKFPADSSECLGRLVGIAENVGHSMTFKILTEDKQIIHRAVIRTAVKGGMFKNRRAEAIAPTLSPKDPIITVEQSSSPGKEVEHAKDDDIPELMRRDNKSYEYDSDDDSDDGSNYEDDESDDDDTLVYDDDEDPLPDPSSERKSFRLD